MARNIHASRTASPRSGARRVRNLGIALAAGGALALAAQAGAQLTIPISPQQLPIPPVAALNATPNPVLVPHPINVGPVGPGGLSPLALGTLVNFSAADSFDPNGAIVKYEWDLDGAPGYEKTTAGPAATHRYTQNGTIAVRVRVTDNQGLTAVRAIPLVRHRAPIARATASTPVAVIGDGITFDGSGSSDDGAIVKYEWDLDNNGTFERTGVQAATSFGTTGTKTVRLRVTDNHGIARVATTGVRIHSRPTAVFTSSPLVPIAGTPTTLDGSSSSDDGAIARYEWDLDGDGTYETDTGAVPTTQTTFATPGPATVRLRVTDDDGITDATQLAFQVVAPEAAPTVAPDTTAPRLVPLARTVRMARNGRVNVRVRCPISEQRCTTRIQLQGTVRPLNGRRLGGRTINLPGGRTMNVQVQLSPAAQRIVRNRGALRARAIITATDQSGNAATTRTPMVIRR